MGTTNSHDRITEEEAKERRRRLLYIHGAALSGVSTVEKLLEPFVYPKYEWTSTSKNSMLRYFSRGAIAPAPLLFSRIVHVASLMDEWRVFGRAGSLRVVISKDKDEDLNHLKGIVLVVDASNLSYAFALRASERPGHMDFKDYSPRGIYTNPRSMASVRSSDWLSLMLANRLEVAISYSLPILILANKCDEPNALTAEQIRDRLLSKYLTGNGLRGLNIRIQECIATQNQGVNEGYKWLCEQAQLLEDIQQQTYKKSALSPVTRKENKIKAEIDKTAELLAQRRIWTATGLLTLGKLDGTVIHNPHSIACGKTVAPASRSVSPSKSVLPSESNSTSSTHTDSPEHSLSGRTVTSSDNTAPLNLPRAIRSSIAMEFSDKLRNIVQLVM